MSCKKLLISIVLSLVVLMAFTRLVVANPIPVMFGPEIGLAALFMLPLNYPINLGVCTSVLRIYGVKPQGLVRRLAIIILKVTLVGIGMSFIISTSSSLISGVWIISYRWFSLYLLSAMFAGIVQIYYLAYLLKRYKFLSQGKAELAGATTILIGIIIGLAISISIFRFP